MRIVSLAKLQEEMVVGKTVYSEDGGNLLQKGVLLTDGLIEKLREKNIPCIYIEDELSAEIEIKETIEPALKIKAIQTVKSIMKDMSPSVTNSKRNNKMYISKKTMTDIRQVVTNLLESLKQTEGALVRIVEMMGTDVYTYNHCVNVAIIAMMIGLEVIHAPNRIEQEDKIMALGLGALLHDIGKAAVDPEIINKPSRLTAEELEQAQDHVLHGYDMIKDLEQINQMKYGGIIKGCVLLHHENLDGSGYPYGWKGDQLKDYVRILRVADSYSAMTSDKSYKKKMPPYQALEQLSALCYTVVDADVFAALKKRLALYPEGTGVVLNTGEKGLVTKCNEGNSDRPIIKIIYDSEGKHYKGFKVLDLMHEMTYFVVDTCYI